MLVETILVVLPFIANISLGLLVISQRPRTLWHKYFFLVAVFISVWATSSYLTDNAWSLEAKRQFAYSTYAAALLSMGALHWFSTAFRYQDNKNRRIVFYSIFAVLVGSAVAATPLVVADIRPTEDYTEVVPGPFNIPYLMILAALFMLTARNMVMMIRNPIERVNRHQAKLIVLGVGCSFLCILISNAIYPAVTGDWSSAALGPLFTFFLVGSVGYSMIRHKLFNIRAAVARSLAYAATAASVVSIYTATVLVLSGTNLLSANLSTLQRVIFAIIAVATGLLFQPFKRFFDHITNALFYRDAYDSQRLIDELNETLVTDVEVKSLLQKTNQLFRDNFKSSDSAFYVRETAYFPSRFVASNTKMLSRSDREKVRQAMSQVRTKIFSVETEPTNSEERILVDILKKNNIEVLGRLVSTTEFKVAGVGYFVMGPKKSGSSYNTGDLRILETIANELVIAVENALRLEEIEQFNVTLQKKIDEATKELRDSNEKLKALDEAKDEFVSMASHQLRTPLTSIKGYLSMVLEGDAGDISDIQKQMLGQAFFSSQRMVYLISDLLNVSRLKTGKFLIEAKPVYLPDLVEDEVNQLKEGAAAKNLKLSFKKPAKFATMQLDDMKIRQVVMNFTDNAIYYTPSGGSITVELKETRKSVEFTVKDSGIGVPKAQQHKLFAKFYRADNARKARPDGTGLGLFMAKKVIVAQGGAIIFKSAEGKGSTFGFSFPKSKLEVKEDTK